MSFDHKKTIPPAQQLPRHIAIIMDGNGRWAKQRGLPRNYGHRQGAESFSKIARYCQKIGIPYLTVYAFSTENWKRPPEEVDAIMGLFRRYLKDVFRYKDENIRVVFLGRRDNLDPELQQLMQRTEQESAKNTGMVLNIAFNYGGRDELVHAVRTLAQQVAASQLAVQDIDEQLVSNALYTAGQPDPDLVIRPSGEHRISNFLLWQSAYAEFVFLDNILWPDFGPEDLNLALWEYAGRNRRYGGI